MIGATSSKGTDLWVMEQLLGRAGLPVEARAEQARAMLDDARARAEERRAGTMIDNDTVVQEYIAAHDAGLLEGGQLDD